MISKEERVLAGIDRNTISPNQLHSSRPNWIDLSLNYNSLPCEKEVAIIVTSWHGHLPWLKATLTKYRETGAFVVCSYDNPFKCWNINSHEAKDLLPASDIFILPHSWVFKHTTYDNEKRVGWFWDVVYAAGVLSQFPNIKHIFTVNGDCVWEKPEGMMELIEVLGDGDLMSVSRERNTIHTCAVVYKAEVFFRIIQYFQRYYAPVLSFHSPEILLDEAVRALELKEVTAPEQPMEPNLNSVDHYSRYNQNSTWKKIVGYRNLSAEYLTAAIERKKPIEKKFFDMRYERYFGSGGQLPLQKYYETGDERYILQLWDQSEDSWWDRLYYPLEHYDRFLKEGRIQWDSEEQI